MPLSRRPSHAARGASSSPIDPMMMQPERPSAGAALKSHRHMGASKSSTSLAPDAIGDAPARGSSPAFPLRTQRSEQEEEHDVLAAAALTAAASAGWERERVKATPRRRSVVEAAAPSTPLASAPLPAPTPAQHTPSISISRTMSFRRKPDPHAPASPTSPTAPPVSGLARFFSTRRKARGSSVDARAAHESEKPAAAAAMATPSPPVVISAQFARPASRSSSRAASPIQAAGMAPTKRRFSRSSGRAVVKASPSLADVSTIEGVFEFPPRASRDSARESMAREGFAHSETQAPSTSSRISHKPSRSVPLHLSMPQQQAEAASQDSIPLASVVSPALSASSSTFKSSRRGGAGEGTHMRRRTSSLAGRLGAFFSSSSPPPPHADEAYEEAPTSPPVPPIPAAAAQEGRPSTHGRSLSNRVGVPARLRGLSFGRRAHTSAGAEEAGVLASAPATVTPVSMAGYMDAASPSAPSTARFGPSTAASSGTPRRKLSLRRMRVSSRGAAEAPPLTPEINAWRGERRETMHDSCDEDEEAEITRVGYGLPEPAVAAGPATPAARASPGKDVHAWLDLSGVQVHGRGGSSSATPPAATRSGARIAPPRYLPTPDLSGPPMDPRSLLREAGVPVTPSVSSQRGSKRGSVSSSAVSIADDVQPLTPPARDARLDTHTTPRAAAEQLAQETTPRRRVPSAGELQGLGLIVGANNSPREHIESRYTRALAQKKKEKEEKEMLRSASPARGAQQQRGARSAAGESEGAGAAFVTDLQAVRWDTVSDGAWSDGRTTPSTVRPRAKPLAPTALSIFTAQPTISGADDTSLDSADGRRPYSLISNSSDGADTPLVAIRRLVVNTADTDAPEASDLFFRPPSGPRSSNSAPSSERTESRRPSPEQLAEEFHALNEERANRHRSAFPTETPKVVSAVAPSQGSASPQDVLSPLPAVDEATPRSGSVGPAVGRRHKRSSTTLSAASKRTSVLDSDAGTGISDGASALEAEVSHARRMAAVPLGKARVAEWARKTVATQVEPLGEEEREERRESGSAPRASMEMRDIPDELSSAASHSPVVVFQAPQLIVAAPEKVSPKEPRSGPTLQESRELEQLAEAARLGKAPSKRIRRSQSQPMSSSDLHIVVPAPPPVPATRSPAARARSSRGSLRASPARRSRGSARALGASEGGAQVTRLLSSPETPTRALRPSQSGNMRLQAGLMPSAASQPIVGTTSHASLRKSRSAHASMSQAADLASLVTPANKKALAPAPVTPVKKTLVLPSVEAKRLPEAASATGSGFTERSRSSAKDGTSSSSKQHRSGGAARKGSYATSEEAILAKRKEQAEREQRHKERELKREEARQAAYARKKKSDPLLAARLALVGLSELDMHEDVPAVPSVRSASPRKMQLSPVRPDWELDIEPAYSVSISSAPIGKHVELSSPPTPRKALDRGLLTPDMAHADLSSPYGAAATSSAGSRASFHTAKDAPSDAESDDGTVAAAPSSSPIPRHNFDSPRADRPLTVASFATMSSAASLVALDFPVPPTRTNVQRSDDGTLLARAGLRDASPAPPMREGEEEDVLPEPSWTRRAALRPEAEAQMKAARPEMAHAPRRSRSSDFRSAPPPLPPGSSYAARSHAPEEAGRKTPTQQQHRKAPELLLNLHGHARPISGRLAPSPEAKKATLVDYALPSPAMQSERASVGSVFSEH